MKEKDITQKVLEDNNDIFADIVNVLLFDGKSEVEENELVNTTVYSQYKAEDGKVHEQERDIAKYWKRGSEFNDNFSNWWGRFYREPHLCRVTPSWI